jgi:hypothetical protein
LAAAPGFEGVSVFADQAIQQLRHDIFEHGGSP